MWFLYRLNDCPSRSDFLSNKKLNTKRGQNSEIDKTWLYPNFELTAAICQTTDPEETYQSKDARTSLLIKLEPELCAEKMATQQEPRRYTKKRAHHYSDAIRLRTP